MGWAFSDPKEELMKRSLSFWVCRWTECGAMIELMFKRDLISEQLCVLGVERDDI